MEYEQVPRTPKTGAFDFSWLNEAPAGKHGFVKTDGENFVFEDGTPVKFFGGNIGFGGAFPTRKVAEAIAVEMSSVGANFARLHATTSAPSTIIDTSKETTQEYNYEMWDRLDYLIYCLKQKGIYIHLDTICGRGFTVADGFTQEEVDFMNSNYVRGVRLFDKRCIELDRKFIMDMLDHYNPYTGLRYADDPAIAIVQYVNEHDITCLQTSKPCPFDGILTAQYNEWLLKKYGSREALDAAWTNDKGEKALKDDEDPAKGTVRRKPLGVWVEPSTEPWADYTNELASPARHASFMEFLLDTPRNTYNYIVEGMREVGVKVPINASNNIRAAMQRKLCALSDVMETNSYWNHPLGPYRVPSVFHLDSMTDVDPRIPMDSGFNVHSVCCVSFASVADKPLVITEWNAATVCQFKADTIFQMACYGTLQNWSGFLLFSYSFDGDDDKFFNTNGYTSFFNSNIDPSMWGQFGMAAAIFRLGLVDEAKKYVEVGISKYDLFGQIHNHNKEACRVIPYVSKFKFKFFDEKYDGLADLAIPGGFTASGDYSSAKNLLIDSFNVYSDNMQKHPDRDAWISRHATGSEPKNIAGADFLVSDNVIAAASHVAPPALFGGAPFDQVLTSAMRHFGLLSDDAGWFEDKVVSDTKQLTLNTANKNFTAEAPKVAVFAGNLNSSAEFDGLKLISENDKVCVSVMSLDDAPIDSSSHLIVYAMGRSGNRGMVWDGNTLLNLGTGPIDFEDIRGSLFIPVSKDAPLSSTSDISAWICDHNGRRINSVDVARSDDGFTLSIGNGCYYEIEINR